MLRPEENLKVAGDLIRRANKMFPDRPAFSVRKLTNDDTLGEWESHTFAEVYEMADSFGSGIMKEGLAPVIEGEFRHYKIRFLAIYAPSILPWYICD